MEKDKIENKKRVMLTVAYDGTRYCGWQLQPNGVTIESELMRAMKELTGEDIVITGASRTDAGVHALCNKAVFDTQTPIPAEKLSYALNQHLPEDIRINDSCEVAADFHPRKVPSEKTYEYRIYNSRFPDPTRRLYSFFTYRKLDVSAMQEAARYLEGTHDFAAFSTFKPEVRSTVRTITEICVLTEGENDEASERSDMDLQQEKRSGQITIRVTGNGFLYHMVRIIAGTLLEVGMGNLPPEEIPLILEKKDRNLAGPTAPAMGLTMVSHRFLPEE